MAYGSITLVPGVNVERTPTLLRAGFSQSSLIRFKDGLVQKYGGWQSFTTATVSGIPRELHAWQDLSGVGHLAVGTTTQLAVITGNVLRDITPQILTTNPIPTGSSFQVVSDVSMDVLVTDPVLGNHFPTQLNPSSSTLIPNIDAVLVNVPLDISGVKFNGFYQSANNQVGNQQFGLGPFPINVAGGSIASVPLFTTTSGGSDVQVKLGNFLSRNIPVGSSIYFNVPTTGNGVTISGQYQVVGSAAGGNLMINAGTTANASGSFSMNGGNAQFIYYLATGNYPANETTGTKIAASDWSIDNWGTILLACPINGPVFQWIPGQIGTAQPVGSAPVANGGIFVSNAQQVLICWGSTGANLNNAGVITSFGYYQNPLQVAWSDSGDYTSFIPTSQNLAGSFVIPSGSAIRGGLSVANQNLIWTDLDLWAMNWIGYPFSYGFNKIGDGAGLIGRHAVQHLRGSVFWWGPNNFYVYDGNGVRVVPCSVWDAVFQNLNLAFTQNIRSMPNTPFNEVGWEYPSEDSVSGENDSYVKFNINEPSAPWDIGPLNRSAWIDQNILGTPIGADSSGNIWQHEQTNDAGGVAMTSSFTTGYFYLEEGEEFVIVDQVIPDFKWSLYSEVPSATIQLSFNVVNYPGDTPNVYGPYTVTQATEYISTRFRGRLMSVTVLSSDLGSFWRIGSIKYRYAPAGRR